MALSTTPIRPRWLLRHEWFAFILINQKDDDSVAVKTLKSRQKWNHRPNRVSISSHITTILATLPTFQQPYPIYKGRKSEGQTGACHTMPFSPFANWSARSLNPHVTKYISCDFILIVLQPPTGLLDFIYQRVSPWSNPSSLQGFKRAYAIGQDKGT
jgi:hypothetical protein